jgi:hypothetical protein
MGSVGKNVALLGWRTVLGVCVLAGWFLALGAGLNNSLGAPAAVVGGILLTGEHLVRAWRAARGTALRGAVLWAGVAVGLGLVAVAEPAVTGKLTAGYATYLATLATLAALLSVLNARRPGGGAWAILMALLVLVFLIPWLEGPGLARPVPGLTRLRLDPPWTLFYGLLVLAGVTNYLPTRYGFAAACLVLGFLLQYLSLTRPGWPPARRTMIWAVVPWTFFLAVCTAGALARRERRARSTLDAAWLWFRDHWGVVWALRVRDRFNQSAEAQGWPIRLGWYGVVPESAEVPDAAEATFKSLLRRFVEPERIDEALAGTLAGPCHRLDGGG